jgi:hypothetical protein
MSSAPSLINVANRPFPVIDARDGESEVVVKGDRQLDVVDVNERNVAFDSFGWGRTPGEFGGRGPSVCRSSIPRILSQQSPRVACPQEGSPDSRSMSPVQT